MKKIYAKDCKVEIVSDPILVKNFIIQNHKQSSTSNQFKVKSVGLYHNDDLVGVAQFCAPRTSKKQREYSTELLRLAFKQDVRVVGGASKLVTYFIKKFNPSDIFTYQDTTGENTAVYEHAGFTFVSQDKKKEYLVAPGKTLESGNRKEVLGMSYATQYGPDRILGTKLGEIIDPETGKRKSNKRIFIEDLGWHIETTPGDKVYEWFNPNITFYTYKITATDSDKYYYGVSHIKQANATEQDCLDDGYYGSGGQNSSNKFNNWKNKHKQNIVKEVIEIFNKKAVAYESEKKLISGSYATDPLCLNSVVGGLSGGINSNSNFTNMKTCQIHGKTKHRGNSCSTCIALKSVYDDDCKIHGKVKFQGSKCMSCSSNDRITEKICKIHGNTQHVKNKCMKCAAAKAVTEKDCITHGFSKHRGNNCMKCVAAKNISVKNCEIHGEVKHRKDSCMKCSRNKATSQKECPIHGETTHYGNSCLKCHSQNSVKLKFCKTHGETKHNGNTCLKCR